MCGIVGIFETRTAGAISEETLRRMNDRQRHRGPDDSGYFSEPGIGLGHRRLSIIDLSTGHQPLFNEDQSVVVVFNGEIYNYQELIPELVALGHVFRTKSDTEVIVHAWEAWGESCVTRFRGMFAFALWDRNRQTLFLARDRLGVKPLYYALLPGGRFIFGSELKSLVAHGGLPQVLDPQAIEEYFALGYVPEPRTIFAGSSKLPPGHTLALRRDTECSGPKEYWDVHFTLASPMSDEEAEEELTRHLEESVRLRMIADVSLGAFLSGGVDSSAVVATMAQVSGQRIDTCSIAFRDPAFDESEYARQVAELYGTRHFTEQVDTDDFDLIDELAGIYDEPFADSSAVPTYRVCQLARKHVKVALSGDGADETFGGYRRYRMHLAEERMRAALAIGIRRPLFGSLGRAYPSLAWAPRPLRAKSTFEALGRDSVEAYFNTVSFVRGSMRKRMFSDPFKAKLGGYDAIEVFRRHARRANTDDPLALIQYLDLKTYLVGDINTKVDRASMAHSLEVREPLMDHRLVEWMATLPSSLKVRRGTGKFLLKNAMSSRLPKDLLSRPKMGFAVPLASWLRGPLHRRVRETVLGEGLGSLAMFDRGYLVKLVEEHQSGQCDHSTPLWTLLMFEAFLRNHHATSLG